MSARRRAQARPRKATWAALGLIGLGCTLDAHGLGVEDGAGPTPSGMVDGGDGSDSTGSAGTDAGSGGLDGTTTSGPALVCENLLVNPSLESGELTGWEVIHRGRAVVGDEYAYDGRFALQTSYRPFVRQQEIDLVAAGLSPEFLDTSPEIRVEDWFREVFSSDEYWIRVRLLDEDHEVIAEWNVNDFTVGVDEDYEDDAYFVVEHTFRDYPAGLRAIQFRDGGQDGEYWQGQYGVVIDASRVEICHPG